MKSSILKIRCLMLMMIVTAISIGCDEKGTSDRSESDSALDLVDTPLPDEAGPHNLFLQLEGERVSYAISIPKNYTGEKPAAFVLALHDGGGRDVGAKYYGARMLNSLVLPAFGELDAIIVAPHSGATGWNSPRNQKVVDRLIEKISESYSIDPERTLVTGYSMGGHGTWFYAEHREDFFKVAVPIAGRPLSDRTNWTNAIYIIHSNDDKQVSVEPSKEYFEKLKDAGVRIEANFVDGLGHFQIPQYIDPLYASVPWILETWKK